MILVELYSKEDCHLCDEARTILEKVREETAFVLREVKLMPGDERYDEYKEMIPVVHINKVFAFKHRVSEPILSLRLRQIAEERSPEVPPDDSEMEPTS